MPRYFAAILDFHSVWYRDDLVQPRLKLEQLFFGLTGPNAYVKEKRDPSLIQIHKNRYILQCTIRVICQYILKNI